MVTETKFRAITGPHGEAKQLAARRLRREMTPAESRLWCCLRANRLDGLHFRRQQVIDGFIADFYCHSGGLIIELDGRIHDIQKDYDASRDHILRARSLYILRFTNSQVLSQCPTVLAQIRATAHSVAPMTHSKSSHCGRTL